MRLRVRRLSLALGEIALWFVLLPLFVWLATPRVWLVVIAVLAACWLLAELFWPAAARWFRGRSPWRGAMFVVGAACIQLAESDLVTEAARRPVHLAGEGLFVVALMLTIWRQWKPSGVEASGPHTA